MSEAGDTDALLDFFRIGFFPVCIRVGSLFFDCDETEDLLYSLSLVNKNTRNFIYRFCGRNEDLMRYVNTWRLAQKLMGGRESPHWLRLKDVMHRYVGAGFTGSAVLRHMHPSGIKWTPKTLYVVFPVDYDTQDYPMQQVTRDLCRCGRHLLFFLNKNRTHTCFSGEHEYGLAKHARRPTLHGCWKQVPIIIGETPTVSIDSASPPFNGRTWCNPFPAQTIQATLGGYGFMPSLFSLQLGTEVSIKVAKEELTGKEKVHKWLVTGPMKLELSKIRQYLARGYAVRLADGRLLVK